MPKETEGKVLLTFAEVCARVRLHRTTIYKWTKKGSFPLPLKPGGPMGHKYYRLEDIEAFERGEYEVKPPTK